MVQAYARKKNHCCLDSRYQIDINICLCAKGEVRGENYLTYRFGTPDNVEFQYPEILDESSWEKFNLHGYSRGGGIANDAMGDYSTSFTNQGIEYTIFQNWRLVSNEYFLGILINIGEKRIVLRGEQGSQSGSLMVLEGKEKLKNEQDAQ